VTLRPPLVSSYRLPPQSDTSMGAALSPPLTDGSYLDAGRFPTMTACISTPAINATVPSTTLPPLYKHARLAGNRAQTLDLDRVPRRTQTLYLDLARHHNASPPSHHLRHAPPRRPSTAKTLAISNIPTYRTRGKGLTRVNSTNVQYEGLRIGGVGRRMN
jgi:hypothetical protein